LQTRPGKRPERVKFIRDTIRGEPGTGIHTGPPNKQMITIRRIRNGEADLFRQIRLASLKDAPYAFSSTYESALRRSPESWREQAEKTAAGPDRATFLAFDGDSPIGIAALYRLPSPAGAGEVIQVWVESFYRRRRVGWKLMDAVFAWAGENGFRTVAAKIMIGNDGALRFYRKLGFSNPEVGPRNGDGEIALVRNVGGMNSDSRVPAGKRNS
jgi:GNAT superfamily N-acetyltransferase